MKQACISSFLRDYLIRRDDLKLIIIERKIGLTKGCLGKVKSGTIRVPLRRQESLFGYLIEEGLKFDIFLFYRLSEGFGVIDFSEGGMVSVFEDYYILAHFISDFYYAEEW